MRRMQDGFDDFFDSFFADFQNIFGDSPQFTRERRTPQKYYWIPPADIYEDNDYFKFKIDLCGVEKEDVKIKYSDGSLTVEGIRKPEQESDNFKYHKVERKYGRFFRKFDVPEEIIEEEISAEFKNGQLTILLPKGNLKKSDIVNIQVK